MDGAGPSLLECLYLSLDWMYKRSILRVLSDLDISLVWSNYGHFGVICVACMYVSNPVFCWGLGVGAVVVVVVVVGLGGGWGGGGGGYPTLKYLHEQPTPFQVTSTRRIFIHSSQWNFPLIIAFSAKLGAVWLDYHQTQWCFSSKLVLYKKKYTGYTIICI